MCAEAPTRPCSGRNERRGTRATAVDSQNRWLGSQSVGCCQSVRFAVCSAAAPSASVSTGALRRFNILNEKTSQKFPFCEEDDNVGYSESR